MRFFGFASWNGTTWPTCIGIQKGRSGNYRVFHLKCHNLKAHISWSRWTRELIFTSNCNWRKLREIYSPEEEFLKIYPLPVSTWQPLAILPNAYWPSGIPARASFRTWQQAAMRERVRAFSKFLQLSQLTQRLSAAEASANRELQSRRRTGGSHPKGSARAGELPAPTRRTRVNQSSSSKHTTTKSNKSNYTITTRSRAYISMPFEFATSY